MRRLLIVSNRLPVSIERRRGKLVFQPSLGGLATGLGSFYKSYNSLWIGWPGITVNKKDGDEKEVLEKQLRAEFNCQPVFLSQGEVDNYYHGFCNKTIWPLFHYFPQYVLYDEALYKSYGRANRLFCDAIMEVAKEDDIIWIHDYHLMLLPKLLREKMPDATIGFFLHIPFPAYEIFHLLHFKVVTLSLLLVVLKIRSLSSSKSLLPQVSPVPHPSLVSMSVAKWSFMYKVDLSINVKQLNGVETSEQN